MSTDTIVAIATPPGQGGVGIVRLSGPEATRIAARIAPVVLSPRRLTFATFRDSQGEPIDEGLVVHFSAPHSFTGEEVVEFQGHGGPIVLGQIQQAALDAGARLARPGEFSERAFLNDKMDLAQAEAVADLIASASLAAARGALKSLRGEFSKRVESLAEHLLALRVRLEALLDFPEEDDAELYESDDLTERMIGVRAMLDDLIREAGQGVLLRDGIKVAILGQPNAGKSSLLNGLARQDRAIVTAVPGTTRDLIAVDVTIGGLPVQLVDTAGLRETDDPVEQEGVRRARAEGASADLILQVLDLTEWFGDLFRPNDRSSDLSRESMENLLMRRSEKAAAELLNLPAEIPRLRIWNKRDQLPPGLSDLPVVLSEGHLLVSALEGTGLSQLEQVVRGAVGFSGEASAFSARKRHVEALRDAKESVELAHTLRQERADGVLVAEELRLAHQALGEITGQVSADDLLGEIFRTFCMGK